MSAKRDPGASRPSELDHRPHMLKKGSEMGSKRWMYFSESNRGIAIWLRLAFYIVTVE